MAEKNLTAKDILQKEFTRDFRGYAPYDKPEIAVSVVLPYLPADATGRDSTRIARDVMNAYFETREATRSTIESYKPNQP